MSKFLDYDGLSHYDEKIKEKMNVIAYNVQTMIDNLANLAYNGAVPTYEDMGIVTPKWSVTTNLTNYTMEESISEVVKNASYQNTLIPDAGYELGTATITMGGTDITSQCYNSATGEISINSVTGNLVISGAARQVTDLNLAYEGIKIFRPSSAGLSYLQINEPGWTLSPFVKAKVGDSITFSVGSTSYNDGVFLFFNENFEHLNYYDPNPNPRTITVGVTNTAYVALAVTTEKFGVAYIHNNTSGDNFDGSTFPSSRIMSSADFFELCPLSQVVPAINVDGSCYYWNGNTGTGMNNGMRSQYLKKLVTAIGINKAYAQTYITPFISMENVSVDGSGKHTITFYANGAAEPTTLFLYDDANEYANYYDAQSSPRAVALDARYNKVQLFLNIDDISGAYIKDTTTGDILWQGATE